MTELANTPPPQPRRHPQQDRSRLAVECIVQSCKKILQEYGESCLNTALLEKVSGYSKGTIYDYFPNIESIVGALFDQEFYRFVNEESAELKSNPEISSVEQILRWLVVKGVEWHRRISAIHPTFYNQYCLYYESSIRYRDRFGRDELIGDVLAPALETHHGLEYAEAIKTAEFIMEMYGSTFILSLRFFPETIYSPEMEEKVISVCMTFIPSPGSCIKSP